MKENEIRPADLRKKCEELFRKDAKDLLSFSNEFTEVNCPACNKKNESINFIKNGYIFKKCTSCRTLYISPRPTPSLLGHYYKNSRAAKFWQTHIFPQTRDARVEEIYKPRVDIILNLVRKYKMKTDLLIDVGAGSGFFGEEVAKRNIFKKIILIEPGPIEIKTTQAIEVINDTIENVKLNVKSNVVTSFEIIEHLFLPRDFLKNIYNLLGDNSSLILTTPNIEGFELITLNKKSINVAGPDHLNYFNPESLKILLEKTGFKNVVVFTPGELDADIVRNKHLEGTINISKQPFLHYILIEHPEKYLNSFQCFLKECNLSSHMLAVGKK